MAKVKLSDAIDEYLLSASATKAERTVSEAGYKLRVFARETGIIKLSELSPDLVGRYFVQHRYWSPNHYNNSRSVFKKFFLWCSAKGYLHTSVDLMSLTSAKKDVDRDWLHIPVEEWPRLLDVAESISPLHRFIIAFGLYTFCRRSEMELLRLDHVIYEYDGNGDRVPVRIRLHIKKSNMIDDGFPISAEMADELERWLAELRAVSPECFMPGANPHLVPARVRNRAFLKYVPERHASHIERMVHQVFVKAGYDHLDGEATHTLRRSGANAYYHELLRQGEGSNALLIIKEMLHHKSIKTTERYLRMNPEKQLRDARLSGKRMFERVAENPPDAVVIPFKRVSGAS